MKEISVYGAGLSGLVAAINLVREGHKITVFEKEETFGGSKKLHPSIHSTPLQAKETWDYIGVDLSDCFVKTQEYPIMWYNRKRTCWYCTNMAWVNVLRLLITESPDAIIRAFGRLTTTDLKKSVPSWQHASSVIMTRSL